MLVLILMLTNDDLICHFWRQIDILNNVTVWAPELLPLSKLWKDLSWHCMSTTRGFIVCLMLMCNCGGCASIMHESAYGNAHEMHCM